MRALILTSIRFGKLNLSHQTQTTFTKTLRKYLHCLFNYRRILLPPTRKKSRILVFLHLE